MPQTAQNLFRATFGAEPTILGFAPGRVNLIGEHTDYNDGFVLPMAIDLGIEIAAAPSGSDRCTVVSREAGMGEAFLLPAMNGRLPGGWSVYPAAVAWSTGAQTGINAAVASGLPFGGGLSSSAALELAFGSLWNHMDALGRTPKDLALACQVAENEGVGVPCGSMDLLASAMGEPGCALLIDTSTQDVRPVPVPSSLAVLVCHTGKERSLAESAYGERRKQCEAACAELGIHSLREASLESLAAIRDETVKARATHVVMENIRVQEFVKELGAGSFAGLARLMAESHESLRDLYEVSCVELDAMVECCVETSGVVGARMTGAGFGGACVALVEKEQGRSAAEAIDRVYRERVPGLDCKVSLVEPAKGARVWGIHD